MSQQVIIKHNKYGMELILDSEISFEELLSVIVEKFQASGNFFKDTKQAISFKGRELSENEMLRIVDTIMENSPIQIIGIMDDNSELEKAMKERVDAYNEALIASMAAESQAILRQQTSVTQEKYGQHGMDMKGTMNPQYHMDAQHTGDTQTIISDFYKGNLRSGQVLECASSVTLIGDVNPGAKIISEGNIVVLGSLKGNAHAGVAGNDNCFIFALDMSPIQLQIGQYYAKSPDKDSTKKKLKRRLKADDEGYNPKIAIAKEENICIEPMTKGCLNNL